MHWRPVDAKQNQILLGKYHENMHDYARINPLVWTGWLRPYLLERNLQYFVVVISRGSGPGILK